MRQHEATITFVHDLITRDKTELKLLGLHLTIKFGGMLTVGLALLFAALKVL